MIMKHFCLITKRDIFRPCKVNILLQQHCSLILAFWNNCSKTSRPMLYSPFLFYWSNFKFKVSRAKYILMYPGSILELVYLQNILTLFYKNSKRNLNYFSALLIYWKYFDTIMLIVKASICWLHFLYNKVFQAVNTLVGVSWEHLWKNKWIKLISKEENRGNIEFIFT